LYRIKVIGQKCILFVPTPTSFNPDVRISLFSDTSGVVRLENDVNPSFLQFIVEHRLHLSLITSPFHPPFTLSNQTIIPTNAAASLFMKDPRCVYLIAKELSVFAEPMIAFSTDKRSFVINSNRSTTPLPTSPTSPTSPSQHSISSLHPISRSTSSDNIHNIHTSAIIHPTTPPLASHLSTTSNIVSNSIQRSQSQPQFDLGYVIGPDGRKKQNRGRRVPPMVGTPVKVYSYLIMCFIICPFIPYVTVIVWLLYGYCMVIVWLL
jgi:hypothetical protein